MLITQTLLITLITLLARCHTMFGTSLINRPIVLGMLTGWIMGDLTQGIIIGGALELAFVGAVSIGAYIPPDMISGTILGTAFAIKAGAGAETALALGYPIATLMLAINSLGTPIGLYLMHKCDKYAEKGDSKKFERMYSHCTAGLLLRLRCRNRGAQSHSGICSDRYQYFRRPDSSVRLCDAGSDDYESARCRLLLHGILRCPVFWNFNDRLCNLRRDLSNRSCSN